MHLPLPPGVGDKEVLNVFQTDLTKVCEIFKPEFILLSAGFDMHEADPLGGMKVSNEGFVNMTKAIMSLAEKHCEGRLISLLEGGYSKEALTQAVPMHIKTLLDP